ncbi:uncharacterized protein CPUR_04686 [Claviceps purpurea 20.1]|uniref:Uncharacterized protein n=1 Tax=Claviceps purpurea (strain 20.1) TaxID=1111077 RepID=M1VW86_CLAP2|nr:uncharacterized protein CPUR_04686 [Claviceps purpurea 20.1]
MSPSDGRVEFDDRSRVFDDEYLLRTAFEMIFPGGGCPTNYARQFRHLLIKDNMFNFLLSVLFFDLNVLLSWDQIRVPLYSYRETAQEQALQTAS